MENVKKLRLSALINNLKAEKDLYTIEFTRLLNSPAVELDDSHRVDELSEALDNIAYVQVKLNLLSSMISIPKQEQEK
jgi:hypothetical protein